MKKLTFLLALMFVSLFGAQKLMAKDIYRSFSHSGEVMTIYYDDQRKYSDVIMKVNNPNFPPEKVIIAILDPSMKEARPTSTYYWFYGYTKLAYILNLEYLNTSEVTTMDHMFGQCESLSSLDVSHFNTSKVTSMNGMFYWCKSLTTLDVSGFDVQNVTNMNYMFCWCNNLTTIYCNKDWSGVSKSESMFSVASELMGGNGTTCDGDNHIDATYAHPDGLNGNPGYFTYKEKQIYAVLDGTVMTLYYDNLKSTRSGILEDWSEVEGTNNMEKEIYDMITAVELNSSMKDAKPKSSYAWFAYLTQMKEIRNLNYLNTEDVTTMDGMFYDCHSLSSLDLSNFKTANVTSMRYTFARCTSLTKLDVSGFQMDKVTTMSYMFNGSSNLKTIYCEDNWNNGASSNYMFYGCTSLVGGNGTVYDSEKTDATYARPDEEGQKGYFSKKSSNGMEEVSQAPSAVSCQKVIRDGQLYLMYEGRMYDVRGQKVR